MSAVANLRAAIADLRRILDDLHGVSKRTDHGRKAELVQMRRQLSDHLAVIRTATEAWAPAQGNPQFAAEFRERFSAMRSKIALHQANWPAVSIDGGGEDYRQSAASVRKSNEDFLAWIDAMLARQPPAATREGSLGQ